MEEQLRAGLEHPVSMPDLEKLSLQGVLNLTNLLESSAREAMRGTLEAYVQNFDPKEKNLEHQGETLARQTERTKKFQTRFGEITLTRGLFYPKGCPIGPAHIPLDEAWGMQGRCATPDVTEAILESCAKVTPEVTREFLSKHTGMSFSTSFIQDILRHDGQKMTEMIEQAEGVLRWEEQEVPVQTEAIVVSLDGVSLPMREQAEAPRGRPSQKPSLNDHKKEALPGESSHKIAMVASLSFYKIEEAPKAENGMELCDREAVRLESLYAARMPEPGFPSFKRDVVAALGILKSKLPTKHPVAKVLLMDGGLGLWGFVKENACFEGFERLMDYWHVCEHLAILAEALHGSQTQEVSKTKEWFRKWSHNLKHDPDPVSELLASVKYYGKKRKLTKSEKETVEKESGYFERNAGMMRYADFVRRGLPIGSGPVEAACKVIVKQRMCQSGMRWKRESGQCVLTLRTLYKSNQWALAWKTYMGQCWLPK